MVLSLVCCEVNRAVSLSSFDDDFCLKNDTVTINCQNLLQYSTSLCIATHVIGNITSNQNQFV